MSAVRAGFMALIEGYKARIDGAPNMPSDEQVLSHLTMVVQGGDSARSSLAASLDDAPGYVKLPPSVLIELLRAALDAQQIKRQLDASETEANEAWRGIVEASHILANPRHGTPAQRQAMALKRLGLIHEPHGKGRVNPIYSEAAERYHVLRTGGHVLVNGTLTEIARMSHGDAVKVIKDEFHLEWESLLRMWKRHGISVRTNAQAFDEESES